MSNINPSKIASSENAYAIVDSRYPYRWLDAWGDVSKFLPLYPEPQVDATSGTLARADCTIVEAGAGETLVVNSLTAGNWLTITTDANENDSANIQVKGSNFSLAAGKPLYFGIKCSIDDATQSDVLIGLAGTDTTLGAAHAIAVGASFVGFTKLDAVTAGYFKTITTATEGNSAAAFTMGTTMKTYEFYWDGYKLFGYVDGVQIACFTTNIPTAVLRPSIFVAAGSAAVRILEVAWMRVIQVTG